MWRAFTEHLPDVDALRVVREVLVEEHDTKRPTLPRWPRQPGNQRASRGRVQDQRALLNVVHLEAIDSLLLDWHREFRPQPSSTWKSTSSALRSGLILDSSLQDRAAQSGPANARHRQYCSCRLSALGNLVPAGGMAPEVRWRAEYGRERPRLSTRTRLAQRPTAPRAFRQAGPGCTSGRRYPQRSEPSRRGLLSLNRRREVHHDVAPVRTCGELYHSLYETDRFGKSKYVGPDLSNSARTSRVPSCVCPTSEFGHQVHADLPSRSLR